MITFEISNTKEIFEKINNIRNKKSKNQRELLLDYHKINISPFELRVVLISESSTYQGELELKIKKEKLNPKFLDHLFNSLKNSYKEDYTSTDEIENLISETLNYKKSKNTLTAKEIINKNTTFNKILSNKEQKEITYHLGPIGQENPYFILQEYNPQNQNPNQYLLFRFGQDDTQSRRFISYETFSQDINHFNNLSSEILSAVYPSYINHKMELILR